MFGSDQKSGITRRFRDVENGLPIETDDAGFIVPSFSSLTIERLLQSSAILVRGQPWTGKTFVANAIHNQQEALKLGDYVWFQPLEKHTSGRSLKPEEWDEWLADHKKRACWIIDSIDEGELIQANVYTEITHLLIKAGKRECRRVRLILFSRNDEVLADLSEFLEKHFGGSFRNVELLPLDRENAERIIGASRMKTTLEAIQNYSLQSVARYPAAIQYICSHASEPNLTEVEVWRGVLEELLRENNRGVARRQASAQEVDHQFRAAAHLAVVMTFAEIQRLSVSRIGSHAPDVADLISANPQSQSPTRSAARDALHSTMFHNGRFSQKNIQEWMCAFGLAHVGLSRLKPLITDSDGNLDRKHFGVLSLLHKTTTCKEVAAWLVEENGGVPPQSDVTLSLDEALTVIDRLESIADTTEWNIDVWGEQGLKHLATPGLAHQLKARITDSDRSANRRELLLQIAIETDAKEVLPTAFELVQNDTEDEDLRRTALGSVFQLGEDKELLQLETWVRDAQPETRIERSIVSAIIGRYLSQEMWSIEECAKHAPAPVDDVVDSTHMLSESLKKGMTIEAARVIVNRHLPDLLGKRGCKKGNRSRAQRRDDDLFQTALGKLLSQEPPNDDDLDMLMPLALHDKSEPHEFSEAFERSTESRRKLFLEEIRRNARRKPENRRRRYIWLLSPDDVEWLMKRIVRLAKTDDSLWSELLFISRGAPHTLKRRARAFVRKHRPEVVEDSDRALRKHRQSARRRRERREREERERKEQYISINDAVEQLLGSDELSLQQKMWQLSWVCLGGEQQRPHDVTGTWDDLPDAVRNSVLDVCLEALQTCEPTPIPDGSSFPASILREAWCFRDILLEQPNPPTLTSELIHKWLPSMFIVHIDGENEVIAACRRANQKTTEDVFLDAIKRELRNEPEHLFCADNLDEEYWSSRLAVEVAEIIVNTEYAEKSRAKLLSILAERVPEAADSLLRETVASPESGVMRSAACDALLRIDVEAAWAYIQADYQERGKAALLDLPSLFHDRRNRISIDSPEWTAERLLELARMLYSAFPPEKDPERSGFITPEHEFRDIRESIPPLLFHRNADGDRTVLQTLVKEQPQWTKWYDRSVAQEKAQGHLTNATMLSADDTPHAGPPRYQDIVKLMENADYRLIRHEDDLLDVVEEELRRIGREAGRHIEMLYLPEEIAGGSKRRHESALQSYIECRLADRLPGRILDTETTISVHRERQLQFRERTDIEVSAPLLFSGWGSVVIEIKWSDNRDNRHNISVGLKKQLGEKYLLGDNKTHGIYLVGWNGDLGTWSRESGERPKKPYTPHTLEAVFRRQAQECMDHHAGLQIRAVVMDLEWPSS